MLHTTRFLMGLGLSLLLSLSACTKTEEVLEEPEQPLLRLGASRLNEPGQPRLRLKRTTSTSPGFPGTTEFLYDQKGRQSAYVYLGDTARFTYDANDRITSILFAYKTTVDITGEQTLFEYDDAQRQVRTTNSLLITINGQYTPRNAIEKATYTMDSQNQPISFVRMSPQTLASTTNEQSFTDGNLTRSVQQSSSSSYRYALDFAYDNRPNPYFGLIGPGVTDMRRFSRNNVAKATMIDNFGTPTQGLPRDQYTIQYEYNEQGLPTRAVAPGMVLRFEYESY